jgi:maleylpyruvate isomerase
MSLAVPLTHLDELADAERRLADDLAARDADWAAAASALPGWRRTHVVAHLLGNAEGLSNLATWARTGVHTPMYPSSATRAAEIERRAQMPWHDLLEEQQRRAQELGGELRALTEPVAVRDLRLGSGSPVNVCDLAATRIREVEIHRVDLAADYRPTSWSATFTLRTLGQVVPFFRDHRDVPVHLLRAVDTGTCWQVGQAGPDLTGRAADLLGWLLGRRHDGVTTSTGDATPPAPAWV